MGQTDAIGYASCSHIRLHRSAPLGYPFAAFCRVLARAEKYEAWGGHFVGAVCCLRQQLSWLDRRTYTTLENLITVV
jgi:hypothetical protein